VGKSLVVTASIFALHRICAGVWAAGTDIDFGNDASLSQTDSGELLAFGKLAREENVVDWYPFPLRIASAYRRIARQIVRRIPQRTLMGGSLLSY
jgi:hypothetical protein